MYLPRFENTNRTTTPTETPLQPTPRKWSGHRVVPWLAVLFVLAGGLPNHASSQSWPADGLKGIKSVRIVLFTTDGAKTAGLSEFLLRTRIENDMRAATIAIDTVRYDGTIVVTALAWKAGLSGGALAIMAQLDVYRSVQLTNDPGRQLIASVWRSDGTSGWVGSNGLKDTLTEAVQRQVSEFIDNWAKANGR